MLNSLQPGVLKDSVMLKFKNACYDTNMMVRNNEVSDIIGNLEKGKAAGLDCLTSEAFIYCSQKLSVLLSMCFQSMFSHGHLPVPFMTTKIIPLVKNRCADLTSISNYRPVAISNIVSKVFESVILNRCESFLDTTDNQFGFKSCHSTDMCIYVMREYIEHFRSRNTSVFVTFLDASKAFDRLNHWLLYLKSC